jgi:hypothetical protein
VQIDLLLEPMACKSRNVIHHGLVPIQVFTPHSRYFPNCSPLCSRVPFVAATNIMTEIIAAGHLALLLAPICTTDGHRSYHLAGAFAADDMERTCSPIDVLSA